MGRSTPGLATTKPSDTRAQQEPGPDPDTDLAPRDPDTAFDRLVVPVLLFAIALAVYAWIGHGREANLDYFVPLADAFLHGRLGLENAPSWLNEVVPVGNLSYVVYPPAPVVLVLPFVIAFGSDVNQAWPSILFGAVNVSLVALILRRMGLEYWPRVILTLVFAFGSITWYSAQAGSSWHFAHVAATLFMLTAIWLCMRDGHPALIGLAFAAAAMSRLPVAMAAPFFIAYFLDRSLRATTGDRTPFGWLGPDRPQAWHTRPDLLSALRLAWPAGVAVLLVMATYLLYNGARFGTPFENGYALIPGLLEEAQYQHGFFSVVNIPRILYAMTLTSPAEVAGFPWVQPRRLGGMSIFLTTPLFLWAAKARRLDWFGVGAWGSVLLILIPILTHADPGGQQFGFRYAQDFYPFLFLLTVRGLGGRISTEAWIAIAIGGIVNLWGMASTYYDWWT